MWNFYFYIKFLNFAILLFVICNVSKQQETCTISNCIKCSELFTGECATCKSGYKLDITNGRCYADSTQPPSTNKCSVKNCITCSTNNYNICIQCQSGYDLRGGQCESRGSIEENPSKSSSKVGLIIGIVIGAFLVISLTIFWLLKFKKQKEQEWDRKRQLQNKQQFENAIKNQNQNQVYVQPNDPYKYPIQIDLGQNQGKIQPIGLTDSEFQKQLAQGNFK